MKRYNENIEKVLDLGRDLLGRADYKELGLNNNDINTLLYMVTDDKLHYSNSNRNHPYAPIHAIYALAQLEAKEAFSEASKLISNYEEDRYISDALKSYSYSIEKVEVKEEGIEELIIVDDEIEEQEQKIEKIEEKEEEEEVIVIQSDELIKEAIIEMQQDKPKPKKQRAPVKQPVKEIKVGRNEPCPCGSGKKYKKCCINL